VITVTSTANGPIPYGTAHRAVEAFVDHAEQHLARIGDDMVHDELHRVLRRPTGYYESRVHHDRATPDGWKVTDGGVIYGHWLEGTGSRNRTTRFKGYATFRRMAAALQDNAGHLADQVFDPYLRRMR
jgi:hypothetical protein